MISAVFIFPGVFTAYLARAVNSVAKIAPFRLNLGTLRKNIGESGVHVVDWLPRRVQDRNKVNVHGKQRILEHYVRVENDYCSILCRMLIHGHCNGILLVVKE